MDKSLLFFVTSVYGWEHVMDVIEAIEDRKSIRAFKKDPVPQSILAEILTIACRAPSGVNQQPWEFAVVTGDILDTLRNRNTALLTSGVPQNRDYASHDKPRDSIYRKRQVALAVQIYKALGIARDDAKGRMDWLMQGARYFDAPVAVIVYTDRCLSETSPLIDIGAIIQTLCLAALKYDLGTCIQNQGVQYANMLREVLAIPPSKRIVTCVSMGYPDWSHPANQVRSDRAPIHNFTTWHGFESFN